MVVVVVVVVSLARSEVSCRVSGDGCGVFCDGGMLLLLCGCFLEGR